MHRMTPPPQPNWDKDQAIKLTVVTPRGISPWSLQALQVLAVEPPLQIYGTGVLVLACCTFTF